MKIKMWGKRIVSITVITLAGLGQSVQAADNDLAADLMDRARQAMIEAQYDRAIKAYNQLLEMKDTAYRQDALELLGLAYERNGQFDKATEEYERYLQLYPDAPGAERVKQRLAGVTTATWQPPKKLRETKKAVAESKWDVYGAFAQYMRRDTQSFDGGPEEVIQFGLTTQLDTTVRRRSSDGLDIKARVNGSYISDLEGNLGDEQSLSHFYVDLNQRGQGWHASIGRQSAFEGGILGRYDGVNLGKRVGDSLTVNLVAGMPVDTSTELSPDDTRQFYGINVDSGVWNKYWVTKGYYIEQQADGMLDRQAVGGELRYLHPDLNMYTLVDYDIHYNSLNIVSSQGSWAANDKTTYNFLLDYRNAPPITTTNALIGQTVDSLSALQKIYTDTEIEQLAQDRTPQSTLLMLGFAHQMSDDYRLDMDISATDLSSTKSSGGVTGYDSSGMEYFLSAQFTARNLFLKRDANIIGMRLAEASNYQSVTIFINSRLPASNSFDVGPRLYLTQTDYDNGDQQQVISPGLRMEYRASRSATIEFDTGYDITKRQMWFGTQDYTDFYIDLGYRIDF